MRAGRALHPVQRAQVAMRADVHVRAVGRLLRPLLPGPQLGGRQPASKFRFTVSTRAVHLLLRAKPQDALISMQVRCVRMMLRPNDFSLQFDMCSWTAGQFPLACMHVWYQICSTMRVTHLVALQTVSGPAQARTGSGPTGRP